MELLHSTWSLLFLLLTHHHAAAHNIVATCARTNDFMDKWIRVRSNPSPLRDLDVQLIDQDRPLDPLSLNISWSINIDSSIHSITGTWIEVSIRSHTLSGTVKYRCAYQPTFTSNKSNYTGLEQLWFSFISTDVHIVPEGVYKATVNNLPAGFPNTQSKSKDVPAPGCENKQMSTHSICSKEKPLTIKAIHEGDEIVVTFESQAGSQKYEILLSRADEKLNYTQEITGGEIRTIVKKFPYSKHCENLTVLIKPHFKKCGRTCDWVKGDVRCKSKPDPKSAKEESPFLLISTGCAVSVIVMLICCCSFCRLRKVLSKCGLNSVFTGPVRVLMVYPAVDSVFQHAVMALADFLQSHKDLNVVIDMWQRGSLAEQGPLRWLHSQADQADKVLIILPPQHQQIHTSVHTDTDNQKLHMVSGMPDYTVPASAQELYSLALNLVASSAHDTNHHHKFWAVHMNQGGERSTVPVQLRGCKTQHLPRDLKKLHQKLSSRQGKKCSRSCRIWSLHCFLNSKKVRQALLQLDRSQINHSNSETVHLTDEVQVLSKDLIP